MKRIITITLMSIFALGIVVAQEALTPAQQRKAERAANDEIQAQKIALAIQDKSFYFLGHSMQIKNLDRYYLRAPYNYVDVQPGYLRVQLPYFTSVNTMNNTPMILDFESTNFTYTVSERRGVYTITIDVKDVTNTYIATRKSQSISYRLVFSISKSSSGSNTTLLLTPNFTGMISYNGDLELDN